MNDPHLSEDKSASESPDEMKSALFAHMVMQQSSMAMMLLGKTAHPETGKIVRDLEGAKFFIDQLEMLELVDEELGPFEVTDNFAGFRMRRFPQQHHGHAGLLHHHVREKRGLHLVRALAGGLIFGKVRIIHDTLPLRLLRISASKKWMSRRSRASTSAVSRMACRSAAPGSTAQETRSTACSGSVTECR